MKNTLDIFTDGGSRGNPGKAACAFVVYNDAGKEIYFKSRFLGVATNNIAEYQGLLMALNWLADGIDKPTTVNMDSELVIKQLKGEYKVKDAKMKELFDKVQSIKKKIKSSVNFNHVVRSLNKRADALVNEELDKNS